jgi:hypothetical protein
MAGKLVADVKRVRRQLYTHNRYKIVVLERAVVIIELQTSWTILGQHSREPQMSKICGLWILRRVNFSSRQWKAQTDDAGCAGFQLDISGVGLRDC